MGCVGTFHIFKTCAGYSSICTSYLLLIFFQVFRSERIVVRRGADDRSTCKLWRTPVCDEHAKNEGACIGISLKETDQLKGQIDRLDARSADIKIGNKLKAGGDGEALRSIERKYVLYER